MTLQEYLSIPGHTQRELAVKLGVSQGLVSQWVLGRTAITTARALAIEQATDGAVTLRELCPDIAHRIAPVAMESAIANC